jgi:paraquat-inducible protein A
VNAPAPRRSLAAPAALATAAALMLVPANVLPVLGTYVLGEVRTDTIFSGIAALWNDGMWGIAAIVFTASILIPLLKLAGLGWLLVVAHRGGVWRGRPLARFYAGLDFIGRWSMLDVFLVAFLTGSVQFGFVTSIEPHRGIVAFAAVVVLTMLATAAFDPRLIWRQSRAGGMEAAP